MDVQQKSRPPMTAREFAYFGFFDQAYIKPVLVNGVTAYVIHTADGRPLCCLPVRDIAAAFAREHAMTPLSVH